MPSPFVGMDPYLEDSAIFPDLHDSVIFCLRQTINELLPPPYFASIGSRAWIETSHRPIGPDVKVLEPRPTPNGGLHRSGGGGGVAVAETPACEPVVIKVHHDEWREPFLEIKTQAGGDRLVTTVEVLSMINKTPGETGRTLYLQKQKEILESKVHLVEIDLLRGGKHSTAVPRDLVEAKAGLFEYHICIHLFDKWEDYFVYPCRLGVKLPTIAVPLLPGDGAISVDLQSILDRVYDTGHYDRQVRYKETAPVPPLTAEQKQWAEAVLQEKGMFP
jgi:hypothetical protein